MECILYTNGAISQDYCGGLNLNDQMHHKLFELNNEIYNGLSAYEL